MTRSPMQRRMVSEIASCLRKYCRGTADALTTNRLIRFAATIAQQRLWGRLRAAALMEGTSLEQQALSSVADVFHREGTKSHLKFAVVEALERDDVSLFLRFQAVVVRAASQELFHRWGENDPLGARLWRTLQRTLRHDPRIIVFPCDRPEWAVLSTETDLRESLVPLDHAEIVRILSQTYTPSTGIAEIVIQVLFHLGQQSSYRRALKIETLFSALREVIAETAGDEQTFRVQKPNRDPELSIAIKRATDSVHRDLNEILDRYQTSKKLNSEVVESFKFALTDLLTDCTDGGPARSYYQYLRAHWSDLTREKYRQTYRTRFEYVAESIRERFFEAMRREFLS